MIVHGGVSFMDGVSNGGPCHTEEAPDEVSGVGATHRSSTGAEPPVPRPFASAQGDMAWIVAIPWAPNVTTA